MKNRKLLDSFNNAMSGIIYTIKAERNMKIHIFGAVLILLLSAFYKLSLVEFSIILLAVGFVIVCELFNTGIEMIVDIIVDVYHPKAKIIKDAAAGAVFVSAITSLAVGYFIFFEKIRPHVVWLFGQIKNMLHM